MNPKQLKKLKKQHKQAAAIVANTYIQQLTDYAELFSDYPTIKFLVNNVLESDRLLKNGLLPQPLPKLILPDDIQDQIFTKISEQYPAGDTKGDRLWTQLSAALPKLDKLLRDYREYLEDTYGMWAYINAPFIKNLSEWIAGEPVLELMAGNGYISKGLRNLTPAQKVFATDNLAWTKENETGKHPVTQVEQLDALAAIHKYGPQVKFVILSWSPDKLTVDWEILQLLRQKFPDVQLIVIGEKNGATNSKLFWEHAQLDAPQELNQNFHSFDLVDEKVYLVK